MSSGGDSLTAGDPGALESFAAEPQLDIETLTLVGENSQSLLGGIGGNQPPPTTGLVREYVWGPGDNGVDELLAQYDLNRAPTWVMQDAGLDCMALADLGGSSGAARVVWQGVYDAYGSVLSAESLYSHASLHAGHKGLFFDRLDVGLLASNGAENPRLVATSKLLGHVRNRAYLPNLGRWAQKDPNATGLTDISIVAFGGADLRGIPAPFDLDQLHHDGANLYSYLGSATWTSGDPLGLYYDDLLMMSYDTAKTASALISNYAYDMTMDLDWASDWSASDYEHSRFSTIGFDTVDESEAGGSGPAQAGLFNVVIKGVGRGFGAARGLMDNVARALYELHHVIPKFLGGLKEGSTYALSPKLHRKFHKELGELTKRILGQHPNARAGGAGIQKLLEELDFTKVIEYRQEVYNLMRRFDAENGTALVSVFRREFAQQRMVQGYVKLFR